MDLTPQSTKMIIELQRAEKALFQKDFGDYSVLIEGIIKFLNSLKKVGPSRQSLRAKS